MSATQKLDTYAFIDVINLENSAIEAGYKTVDYEKLYTWLKNRMNCKEIYYYSGEEAGDIDAQEKHQKLKVLGYNMRVKKSQIYKNRPKKVPVTCKCGKNWIELVDMGYRRKANCDVTLTFDAMRNLANYTKAIVFTGDGDFYDLLEYLYSRKRDVIVISLGYKHESKRTSTLLRPLFKERKVKFMDLIVQLPVGILQK